MRAKAGTVSACGDATVGMLELLKSLQLPRDTIRIPFGLVPVYK